MKKKIFVFLIFFIVSIFGNLKEEIKEAKHIYISLNYEIKEKKSEKNLKYIDFKFSELKSLSLRDKSIDKPVQLISFNFTPIIKIDLKKIVFTNRYFNIFHIGILERYSKRVLII